LSTINALPLSLLTLAEWEETYWNWYKNIIGFYLFFAANIPLTAMKISKYGQTSNIIQVFHKTWVYIF
ncbi:MAG: hypothetical protein MJK15_22575, partial [Colwellia sp.]|nr:hypothetical protein [Colwellia sp.]